MDRLDALRVFIRVAELESFSRAAEDLGLPRATVSAAVAQLEAAFAARLLQRTTRKVHLTADGASLLERGRGLLEEFEALRGHFRDGAAAPASGRLTVDLPSRIARRIVLPALPELLARHPQLDIDIGADDKPVDLVEDGVDCAVRVGPLAPSSLVARPLGMLELVNCASPAYLASRPKCAKLDDLQHHVAVHYSAQRGTALARRETPWDYVGADGAARQVPVLFRVAVHTTETYIAAAVAGLGLVQVPAFDVQEAIARGDLVQVLPRWRPAPMPVHALYPHRRHLSPRVRIFIAWFEALLRQRIYGTPRPA